MGLDSIEPDPSTPEGIIHAKVKEIWNRVLPRMIMAKSDAEFAKAYKDGIAQIDKAGASTAEQAIFELHLKDLAKKGVK
jgi:putative aldouronate transport system substrate-binding protein